MAAPPCSAGDLEGQLGRAAFADETRDLVPVDDVRDSACDHDRDAELPELLNPPGVHAKLFAFGVDRFFHRSNSLTSPWLIGAASQSDNRTASQPPGNSCPG